MAFNKVILVGNMVETPELKTTQSGTLVTNFRIAVARDYKKETQPETDFISVTAWNSTAKFVTDYFTKGRAMLVCGKLQQRSWTDNDGNKHYTMEVAADEVRFVDKKPDGQRNTDVQRSNNQTAYTESMGDFAEVGPEDDLPF